MQSKKLRISSQKLAKERDNVASRKRAVKSVTCFRQRR
jgi:hypothetical protein